MNRSAIFIANVRLMKNMCLDTIIQYRLISLTLIMNLSEKHYVTLSPR